MGQSTCSEGNASEAEVETRGMCLQCGEPVLNKQKRVKSELGYVHDLCMPSFQVTNQISRCHSRTLLRQSSRVVVVMRSPQKRALCALTVWSL